MLFKSKRSNPLVQRSNAV